MSPRSIFGRSPRPTEARHVSTDAARVSVYRGGERWVLVGGPRMGKSTYARELRRHGVPTFCTDPLSLVKEPESGVTYLPEGYGLGRDSADRFVADNWFAMAGPWCIDGVVTVRALRKLIEDGPERLRLLEGVRIVKFSKQYENAVTKPGQVSMAKAIETVWREIAPFLPGRVEFA
jgi:hypothetical protein